MDDLLQEFIAETRETLEALAGEIVAWESDPADRARLDAIFRFVHTVKGSCGFLDLPRLARLSHAAEDALSAVRAGDRRPDKRLVDAVLGVVDRIGELVEAIDAGASLDDSGEDLLIAALGEDAEPAAASTPAQTAPLTVTARAPTRSVRLSVDLLDRMMTGMSDMVLARNELARRVRDEGADPVLEAALDRLSATVADMRETVTRTRMQTVDALFSPLPRMVRDTAAALGKQVALTIDGSDVELDREMIEMMRDPLVHMVRNSLDHGIESPAERTAAGKRETGRLTVSARQSGNRIIIEIADDGRGIDVGRLVAGVIAREPAREAAIRALPPAAKLDLIFEPGVTSRAEVTAISGRGVGMDVVRANVEQIGGRIEVANRPGQGLLLSVEVPLTLAILTAVIVRVGQQRFALPRVAIEEIVVTHGAAIRIDRIGGARMATVRGRRLALVDLAELLELAETPGDPAMLAIVDVPGGAYALGIEAVLDTEELVVKPAAPAVMAAGVYAGQTLPDSGVPMLLLDCAGMAAAAGLSFERREDPEEQPAAAEPGLAVFLFEDLDGQRRLIPVAAIDRVERVAAAAIAEAGGRLRLVTGGRTVPLVAVGSPPPSEDVPILRLRDGPREVGYVIREAIDIVALDAPFAPMTAPGAILGVAVLAGEALEVVDPLWLLAQAQAAPDGAARRPSCRLGGAGAAWMTSFLAPALEAAGYRIVGDAGVAADVTLVMEGDEAFAEGGGAVLTLSREPERGVYCYDRAALVSALADRLGARG